MEASSKDPTKMYEILNSELQKAKKISFPVKLVRFCKYKHKLAGWMTNGILKSLKYKDDLYKAMLKSKNLANSTRYETLQINFNTYNKILKRSIIEAKKNYYFRHFELYRNNMKQTWKTINEGLNRKSKESFSPKELLINNVLVTDKNILANHMNEYFANIAAKSMPQNTTLAVHNVSFKDYLNSANQCTFCFQKVTSDNILILINNLKASNTTGLDDISNKMLKVAKNELCEPLTFIINGMIESGEFPDQLKRAKLKPLFKKGDVTDVGNYRPISLLPAISKIFERVIHNQLTQYLTENNLLYQHQYGYRKQHSAELAATELIDRCTKILDQKGKPLLI